jgi:oligopeptide transport system ATP-binding protein
MPDRLLTLEDFNVAFATHDGTVAAVSDVGLTVRRGERLGVLGESGSGKSHLFLGVLGLLANNGRASGVARFDGQDLVTLAPRALRQVRGRRIAMIFQDPMTALNPYLTIAAQLTETLGLHRGLHGAAAHDAAAAMLGRVGIADASRRLDLYPHELSGGMRQRVLIAMALLGEPELLIADEPTTALDTTVQGQILELLRSLAITQIVITHDFGVLAGFCDRVAVMYAGRIVETGPVRRVFYEPQHPYTRGLLQAVPKPDQPARQPLATITGQPPDLAALGPGCAFAPRCAAVMPRCQVERPVLRVGADAAAACHLVGA